MGHQKSVFKEAWPKADAEAMKDTEKDVAVQINGKTKVVVKIAVDADQATAIAAGKAALGSKLAGTIIKEIYVPGRIINIVCR